MQNENARLASALMLVSVILTPLSFAANPCPSCFATYISATENNGTVNATLFLINQTIEPQKDISFYEEETKKFLNGTVGMPDFTGDTIVLVDSNVSPVANASLHFYYYNRTGGKENLTNEAGEPVCAPAIANLTRTITYTDSSTGAPQTKTIDIPYANCTIPYRLYENSSITIYIEYMGNETAKPSRLEIVIYDVNAGGLNAFANALQQSVDPSQPQCLAGLILLGLLLASLYFSGKSPLSYMDISVLRAPKPKAIAFGPLTAGAGNIRFGLPSAMDKKYLEWVIRRHTKADFKGSNIQKNIENAIDASKASVVQKYFARLAAVNGKDWRGILAKDEKGLMREAEEGLWKTKSERQLSPYAMMAMHQWIALGKMLEGMGIVVGDQPKQLTPFTRQLRKVPLIGTYLTIATGSFFYGLKAAGRFAKGLASAPTRAAFREKYEQLDALEDASKLKGFDKVLFNVASFTDPKKLVMGRLFPLQEHIERFYKDTRDAMYDEVIKNILWLELYDRLAKELGDKTKLKKMLEAQMNLKEMLVNDEFFRALEKVKGKLPQSYLDILAMTGETSEKRAELMLGAALKLRSKAFIQEAKEVFDKINGIDKPESVNAYDKTDQLVNYMRNRFQVDKPCDLSESIKNGKFFVTSGRNGLYYEEAGSRKNFNLFALALNEFMGQTLFLSSMLKGKGQKLTGEDFTLADAFKLAWAKMTSQLVGHVDWTKDVEDTVTITDPRTGKGKSASFVRDALGLKDEELNTIQTRMKGYLKGFLTDKGETEASKKDVGVEALLYGYRIKETKKKEEETRNPLQRRYWYYLESESYPDQEYWRANMNFVWTSIPDLNQRNTVLFEVRNQKYAATVVRPGEPWQHMGTFIDKRVSEMINGTQWDFFGYEKRGEQQFERFARPHIMRSFNETWESYSKMYGAFGEYYKTKADKSPNYKFTTAELFQFLGKKENQQLTYDMLGKSKTPFIFTHDMNYIPYVKGLPVADFDRVINGVFVIKDDKGGWKRFNAAEADKYRQELMKDPNCKELQDVLTALGKLKKAPAQGDVEHLERALDRLTLTASDRARVKSAIAELKGITEKPTSDVRAYLQKVKAATEGMDKVFDMVKGLSMSDAQKFELLRAAEKAHPGLQPLRSLNDREIEEMGKILKSAKATSEVKLAFLTEFSRLTHDWKSLWSDADFFKLTTAEEAGAPKPMGKWITKYGEAIIGPGNLDALYKKGWSAMQKIVPHVEAFSYAYGMPVAQAQASNVAVSELYRERGHDMRMRIKTPGYMDEEFKRLGYAPEEAKDLTKAYDSYANSYQRFFMGWMDSVTRDPRGSSTQWGRQWYLQTMYHRGGAMHPEMWSGGGGGERAYLSPAGSFFGHIFGTTASLNWMFAGPIVRAVRAFQTASYGYPTRLDKNITPTGDFDLMDPWPHVRTTWAQKWRALLNPAESVFSVQKFNLLDTLVARPLQTLPGLNVLPWFFPKLESGKAMGGKALEEYSWYKKAAGVPGISRPLLEQQQTQRTYRGGKALQDAVKQNFEDFLQYSGGGFVQHFTDTANPGVSYMDFTGRGRLAPRIASYLTRDLTARTPGATEAWRDYYAKDAYVRGQATTSFARRGIAAEAKRLHFQTELTGYGPADNPMWAALSPYVALPWMGKWLKGGKGIPTGVVGGAVTGAALGLPGIGLAVGGAQFAYKSFKERKAKEDAARAAGETQPSMLKDVSEKVDKGLRTNVYICPHCGATVSRGRACPSCRRYV